MYSAVEDFYVDDLPRHVHPNSSELSIFRIMSYHEFSDLPPEELQEILRHKQIVVTDMEQATYEFDEDGLATVSPNIHRKITIHGLYSRFLICISELQSCYDRSFQERG